jgi:hypothetical protein
MTRHVRMFLAPCNKYASQVSVSVDYLFYFCCTSPTNHGLSNKDLEAFSFSPKLHDVIG